MGGSFVLYSKLGKGKNKVIVQSGFDDETATTVATSKTIRSLKMKSSQGDKGEESLKDGREEEP